MRSASARSRAARSGSVAASASAMPLSAHAFLYSSVMELAMRVGAVGVGGCHRLRDAAQRRCLPVLVGDGVGDAFGAVGVGGCQRLRDAAQRRCLPVLAVMELAMRSARSGSVAASRLRDAAQRRCLLVLVGDGVGDAFGAVGVGGCQRLRDAAQRQCLPVLAGDRVGDAFGVGEQPGSQGSIGSGRAQALLSNLASRITVRPDAGSAGYGRDRGGAGCCQDPLDRRHQPPGVRPEALMPDNQPVPAGQARQALGKIIPARHDRALDQDRDNPYCASQGSLNFQPHNIIGIIQPPTAALVGRDQPRRADDRQQHRAGRHRAADLRGEVHAQLDRVHIDENLALAEPIGQAVIQPSSQMAGFLSPVADKDATALHCGHIQARYRRPMRADTMRHKRPRSQTLSTVAGPSRANLEARWRRQRLPAFGAEGHGTGYREPAANAVLTTVVDTWGRSWTPGCPSRSSGLIRRTAVDSRGPGRSPEKRNFGRAGKLDDPLQLSSHHSSATHGAVQGSFVEDAVKEWAVVECEQGVTDGNLLSCP